MKKSFKKAILATSITGGIFFAGISGLTTYDSIVEPEEDSEQHVIHPAVTYGFCTAWWTFLSVGGMGTLKRMNQNTEKPDQNSQEPKNTP